ncbi:TPA: DNA-binding protein [Pseudomonas aeruginosa]|nr:DNA-binding protein [Pseudomonas aeruginosa]
MSESEPQKPELQIYCDMRESRSGILEQLAALGAKPVVGELETGDYVLTSDLVVERKTAVDFVASVLDGRLFNQVGKMRLNFARPVFLIEGDVYNTRSAIAREAIDGALSFLVAIQGCTVLYVKDQAAAAGLIYRMAKHAQEGLGYDTPFRRGKSTPGKGEALFMIEGTPGVGPTTAIKILNHFRSVQAFINASLDDLRGISGLGPKKAERIHQAIRWELPAGEEARSGQSLFSDG